MDSNPDHNEKGDPDPLESDADLQQRVKTKI